VSFSSRPATHAAVIIAAAVVGGCASIAVMSHIPVSTMSRLFALKLANIDPEDCVLPHVYRKCLSHAGMV